MNPLATMQRLLTALLRRANSASKTDAWDAVFQNLPYEPVSAEPDPKDAYDDRRVPRDPRATPPTKLHIVKSPASQSALALLFELTLEQAIAIIDTLPDAKPNLVNLEIEQRAFLRIRHFLEQHNFARQPARCLPILNLLARRMGHLNDAAQRALAMEMIALSLRTSPQIDVVEALVAALASMPPALQQRALDQIEEFIVRTADIPLSHVDILLGLTNAVGIDGCRERASALITTGLKRLRDEPVVCGKIRRSLVLAYCTADQGLQLKA